MEFPVTLIGRLAGQLIQEKKRLIHRFRIQSLLIKAASLLQYIHFFFVL